MNEKCTDGDCQDCTHDCSSCSKAGGCDHKKPDKLTPNKNSNIKHVFGVVSGKGGVGKSLVCSLLAHKLNTKKLSVGILDADVTGPSIPKIFGVNDALSATEDALIPAVSSNNIKLVSANLLLENPDSPVAWRGPVVSGAISQFFNMTNWGDIDVLLVDMPPGTSDVFLTVMQQLPVEGIICVSTPQDLVEMIVGKAINLARMMDVSVDSLVENMSYFQCPKCDEKHEIYGSSKVEEVADKYNIKHTDKLAINPDYAKLCDQGKITEIDVSEILNNTYKAIKEKL